MTVEKAPKSIDDENISGDAPAYWDKIPVEIIINSDLDLNDRNQRRRFRRKISDIIDRVKDNRQDLLAFPQPSRKVKLVIGGGIAAAAAVMGARTLHKYRQSKK